MTLVCVVSLPHLLTVCFCFLLIFISFLRRCFVAVWSVCVCVESTRSCQKWKWLCTLSVECRSHNAIATHSLLNSVKIQSPKSTEWNNNSSSNSSHPKLSLCSNVPFLLSSCRHFTILFVVAVSFSSPPCSTKLLSDARRLIANSKTLNLLQLHCSLFRCRWFVAGISTIRNTHKTET